FFAGSGAIGAVSVALDRRFVCVDQNPAAIEIMTQRLSNVAEIVRA
ncbi:site-specific DNA-methyltransferase, partial [Vibrio vulnificus]